MKQIKLFINHGNYMELEKNINEFCKLVNVIDIRISELIDEMEIYRTVMVIYEK